MATMLTVAGITFLISLVVLVLVFFYKNKKDTKKLIFSTKIKYFLWQTILPPLISIIILLLMHMVCFLGVGAIQIMIDNKYPSYVNSFSVDNDMENAIPFVGWFTIPYAMAWVYWYLMPFFIYFYCGKKEFYKYVLLVIVMDILAFIIFIVIPIKNRMLWPNDDELSAYPSFIRDLWNFLSNSKGIQYIMCPSEHIYFTLIPFIFIRKNGFKKIATYFSLFAIVMITLSVLFLKVHYIIDVLVAIALTEIVAWFIEKYPYLSEKLNKGITYINRKLHLETK